MRYALAIAMTAALALGASVADAASKKHPRYARHARAPAGQYAPVSNFGPTWPIERPRAYVPANTCIQDEGYGRWTYCGQGSPGARTKRNTAALDTHLQETLS